MGLFGFMKNQYMEFIEWIDTSSETLVYPIPTANHSIKMGATLTVRESQAAVFVNEGKVADVFAPGKYTLSQENLPLLSALRLWKSGFKLPFKADIYYVNTKKVADLKWGTVNPLIMKSPEFGDIRLKANGTYSFRVMNAEKFMKEIFGTNQIYDTPFIKGQLKSILIKGLSDFLNETYIPAVEFISHYDEISDHTENNLQERFAALGLELCSFIIEHIALPDELVIHAVEQTEAPIEVVETKRHSVRSVKEREKALPEPTYIQCVECGHLVTAGIRFCSECGIKMKLERPCSCGYIINGSMKFCPDCGVKV